MGQSAHDGSPARIAHRRRTIPEWTVGDSNTFGTHPCRSFGIILGDLQIQMLFALVERDGQMPGTCCVAFLKAQRYSKIVDFPQAEPRKKLMAGVTARTGGTVASHATPSHSTRRAATILTG